MADHEAGRRTLLLTGLALWLVVALSTFLARRYLYNVLFGPFPVDPQSLATRSDVSCQREYFVRIEPSVVRHLFPYAHSGGAAPYAVYALLGVGDKTLLARLPAQHGQSVSGTLEELSAFERKYIVKTHASGSAGGRPFQSFRFNGTRYFRTTGYLLAVVPLGTAAACATWLLALGARRRIGSTVPAQLGGRAGVGL